jgi:hypothetical protein
LKENDHVSQSDSRSCCRRFPQRHGAGPTAASAGGGGFGWHPHHHWGHGFGFGVGYMGGGYDGCYQTRRVFTPYGVTFRTVNVCAF